MAGDTKKRILKVALELFAQKGYLGTSMRDIAQQLGLTKAALYKHYTAKQDILDKIIERMNEMDAQRAKEYGMPETEDASEAYLHTPADKIRSYALAQFGHWTEEKFSSDFRKMLTLEQYRDPEMAQLYQTYLAEGPLSYMEEVFVEITSDKKMASQFALEFYGPIFLLYSIYDGAKDKKQVVKMVERHVEEFAKRIE